jgi:hypothetical protein
MAHPSRLTAFAFAAFVTACGGSSDSPLDAATTMDASAVDAAGTRWQLDDVDRTPDPACTEGTWVVGAKGRVIDESGAPVVDAGVQLCLETQDEEGVCLAPAFTDENGEFEVVASEMYRCWTDGRLRLLAPTLDYATTYLKMDLNAVEDAVVEIGAEGTVYRTRPPETLPPIGDEETVRAVAFEGGMDLMVVPDSLFSPRYEDLGARRFSPSDLPASFAFEGEPLAVWALSPETALTRDAKFDVVIENSYGLAPGDELELHLMGGIGSFLESGEAIPEGEFARIGTMRVSADGQRIESLPGEGLSYFSWFALVRPD